MWRNSPQTYFLLEKSFSQNYQQQKLKCYSVYCRNYDGNQLYKIASGVSDFSYFEHPDVVHPIAFKDTKIKKNALKVKIPAKSIVVLKIK